jgi:hypothetical protein
MRPRERRETSEQDLFRSRLDQIIDMKHALVKLDLHRCSATSILPVPLSCSSFGRTEKGKPAAGQSSPRFGISVASSLARELLIPAVAAADRRCG